MRSCLVLILKQQNNEIEVYSSLSALVKAHKDDLRFVKAAYWEKRANDINLSMPESVEYYEHKFEQATEYHAGLKSGKYPREHMYSLTYAKKAVNEAQKNYDLAKKLWS